MTKNYAKEINDLDKAKEKLLLAMTYVSDAISHIEKAKAQQDECSFDAPQTARELYQRIIDCNPATYQRFEEGHEKTCHTRSDLIGSF